MKALKVCCYELGHNKYGYVRVLASRLSLCSGDELLPIFPPNNCVLYLSPWYLEKTKQWGWLSRSLVLMTVKSLFYGISTRGQSKGSYLLYILEIHSSHHCTVLCHVFRVKNLSQPNAGIQS